jgi:hypothetical protein
MGLLLGGLGKSFASFAFKGFNRKDRKEKPQSVGKQSAPPDSFVCNRIVTIFCIAQWDGEIVDCKRAA